MSKIFISYRRDDSAGYAGRLYDRLVKHFGDDHLFMDIDQIEPGEDFVEVLQKKLQTVQVAVILIGKSWLDIKDEFGQRRLDNPDDWVRIEIGTLLKRKIRVIPVLVGGAIPPKSSQLPKPLISLARRQAFEIKDTRFHGDVDKLIPALEKIIQSQTTQLSAPLNPVSPDVSIKPDFKREIVARQEYEPKMVRIPSGEFMMGSLGSEPGRFDYENPQHEVTIAYTFEIGQYPITFSEYDVFAKETERLLPDDNGWGRGNRPVIHVSFDDAQAYVQWLSKKTGKQYRLPTEAEWEYVARAGSTTVYWWGDAIGQNNAVCDGCGSQWDTQRTAPVGSFKPNTFDVYDTAGNVWEWTQDCWHDNYQGAPSNGSAWLKTQGGDCSSRVIRGGSWIDGPRLLRSAGRVRGGADVASVDLGFRVARDL